MPKEFEHDPTGFIKRLGRKDPDPESAQVPKGFRLLPPAEPKRGLSGVEKFDRLVKTVLKDTDKKPTK